MAVCVCVCRCRNERVQDKRYEEATKKKGKETTSNVHDARPQHYHASPFAPLQNCTNSINIHLDCHLTSGGLLRLDSIIGFGRNLAVRKQIKRTIIPFHCDCSACVVVCEFMCDDHRFNDMSFLHKVQNTPIFA